MRMSFAQARAESKRWKAILARIEFKGDELQTCLHGKRRGGHPKPRAVQVGHHADKPG